MRRWRGLLYGVVGCGVLGAALEPLGLGSLRVGVLGFAIALMGIGACCWMEGR